MSEQTPLPDGFRVYKPSSNAPEYIKANIDIDIDRFHTYAMQYANGQGRIRLVVKESRAGGYYASLDEYKPRDVQPDPETQNDSINPDDIPF